ncbi:MULTISPECIES: RagB/SusD family nutrient uptake outer membrane protein [Flavobacteriaceae]|uniref:RagB/SusD family nutrient uptake outer membrane protein n=2 Tax=Flagellimonas TaxID=444459 RepID=UPI000C8E589F|nr:RagB/SusD family nutrient uptake outer membrane protein [Allomuricauda sp.]UBZ14596.1 RagB/SusD family nutrient uptake outer membrane protein [Allomuricauda aquimarina]|tara:strand:+ start:9132 stop:10565 length:1434 start_codon:yes stop_codon:yes gene_type:complete
MKFLKIIIPMVFIFTAISCSKDFLEPQPTSAVSEEGYFKTDEELESGILNMYDGIQGTNDRSTSSNHSIQYEFYVTEMRTDNTRGKGAVDSDADQAQFVNYNIRATNGIVADYYRSMYNIIYRANVVLDNLGVASDANRARFEGEAKFVRAYAYFNLVRLYGDVPLVDKVIAPLDTEISYTRIESSIIYDFIEEDLLSAVANLGDGYKNRASKAAAEALLAKVYLTIGEYSQAQTLCESIMKPARGFSLESNFKDVFYNEGNDEVIFAVGYEPDLIKDSQGFSSEWLNAVGYTAGVNYVTKEMRDAFDQYGGDRTLYSIRQDVIQPSEYQVAKYIPNGDENLGIAPIASDPRLAGNDWIVLRYADVLLMHVEAILAGAEATTSSNAIASFQEVRNRAGITTTVATITKEDLLNERRVELAFENQRFFDLLRLGEAQNVLSAYATENGYNFTSTTLLLPIPSSEINLSKGLLEQNPGY